MSKESWQDFVKNGRPWWWWFNPWLYVQRRDRAYADALEVLSHVNHQIVRGKTKEAVS